MGNSLVRPFELSLADLMTLTRFILIAPISFLLLHESYALAMALFAIAILSDILDGPTARAQGTDSPRGAVMDGVADFALCLATAMWTWWLFPEGRALIEIYVVAILPVAAGFIVFGYLRTGQILFLHLTSGKALCLLLYLMLPLALFTEIGPGYVHLVGISGILYYLESFLYVLRGKEIHPGESSAFF
jgi:phosphatidylglycerophosphate synthase